MKETHTSHFQDAQLPEEVRIRGQRAVDFYDSEARKQWSSQRIENKEDDIRDFLPGGIEKLRTRGSRIVTCLLGSSKNEET